MTLGSISRRDYPELTARALGVSPIARAQTIPSAWYVGPRFHELDRVAVFAASWQPVARVDQVAKPGQFAIGTVADNPIIAARDQDGTLRAFYNVCRHRGGPLATCDGTDTVLKCHYHGWTYRLDGSLRGVPAFDRVELFDKADFGLVPVAVATWESLVFVHLGAKPEPITTPFAGIAERIAPQRLGGKTFHRRTTYEVACNWKVYVDNYLEGYHVPHVHPELTKLYDYRSYVTEVFPWYSLQHSALSSEPNIYAPGGGEAFYYWVFPNLMLNILPGRLQTNVVQPIAANRCRVIFDYFYDDTSSPAAQRRIEEDLTFADDVQREDIEICEHVQRGLNSFAYDRGRYSVKYEEGVWHFHKLLREAYATRLGLGAKRAKATNGARRGARRR
jgi:choline monooxygenase